MRRRLSAAYHIERSVANRLGLPGYPCACNRCRGAIIRNVETVGRHHIAHGRDPYLLYPVIVSPSFFENVDVFETTMLLPGMFATEWTAGLEIDGIGSLIYNVCNSSGGF